MRGILMAAALAALSASSTAQEQKLTALFNVLEWNSVAKEYLPIPTFVSFRTTKKHGDQMTVEHDFYGIGEYQNETQFTNFPASQAQQYRAFITKYLEWEEMAARDGDQFQKEIGRADGIRGKLKFTFVSVSASTHLLLIEYCTIGICLDNPIVLDREGAIGFDSMLQSLVEDGVQALDVDSKYN